MAAHQSAAIISVVLKVLALARQSEHLEHEKGQRILRGEKKKTYDFKKPKASR